MRPERLAQVDDFFESAYLAPGSGPKRQTGWPSSRLRRDSQLPSPKAHRSIVVPIDVLVFLQSGELIGCAAEPGAKRVHLQIVIHTEDEHSFALTSQASPRVLWSAADSHEGHGNVAAIIDDMIQSRNAMRRLPVRRSCIFRAPRTAYAIDFIGDEDQMASLDAEPRDVLPVLDQVAALGLIYHVNRAALPCPRQRIA